MPQAKFQINHYQKFKLAAIFSCAAVFVGGVYFFQPFSLSEDTNATTETTQNGDYYIETTTTDLNLSINTTPAGTQETASHDVIVKTDDPAGFTLTVSVNNDTSNALNLNGSASATEKFAATSGTYASPKALDDNTWGFADTLTKKNNDQWAAVPLLSSAQQIKQTSSATPSGDTTTVHYGIKAKYDGAHSNGNYSNTIVYSVTGNTIPKNPIADNMYMQDITQEMCADTEEYATSGTTYTLIDTRDNSTYQVRKLADGNCWMVQNLRLINKTISASDSDTSGSFTIPASSTSTGTSTGRWGTTDNANGINHTATYYANNTTYGAYYNWYTATAGSGTYSTGSGVSVDYSICPKGWKLPYGTQVNKSWYYLYNTGYSANVSNFQTATNTGSGYWAGYVNNGTLNSAGFYGYGRWWSRTAVNNAVGCSLDADSGYVDPQTGPYKRYGLAVRCVLSSI